MSRLAQVVHVAAKDLRELRWLVALYAVAVGLATARELNWTKIPLDLSRLPLVVFYGMALVATAVQSDSPARTDSPWAGRPLYPSAVIGAKALFALSYVLLLPLLGEIAALHVHGVRTANIPTMAARSAVTYVLLLLAAALVGAATRNFRTCVLVLMVVAVVELLVFSSFTDVSPSAAVAGAIPMIVAAGGIALLLFLYRTHDARRLTLGAVVTCSGLLMGAAAPPYTVRPTIETSRAVVTIAAVADSLPINARSQFRVSLNLDTLDFRRAERLLLIRPVAHLSLDDGRDVRVPLMNDVDLHVPAPDSMTGTHWAATPFTWDMRRIPVEIYLNADRQADIGRHRVLRVTIDGTVTTWRGHVAATVPIRVDSAFVASGRQYTITKWTRAGAQSMLDVAESWVSQDVSGAPRGSLASTLSQLDIAGPQITFLNDRAPVPNGMIQSHSQDMAGANAMILPGVTVQDRVTHFETGHTPQIGPGADDAWFAGLRIAIVEWTFTGSFPTRVDVTMP